MSDYRNFSFGLYEKALPVALSWPERFNQAQQAGYEFIEISIDDSDERQSRLDWTAAQKREFRTQVEASGMYIPTMCLSGHHRYPIGSTDSLIRSRAMEIMEKAINFASETGIRIVQLAGYDEVDGRPSTEQTAAFYTENLEKSIGMAARLGITLAIENMGVPFMDSIQKVMSFVNLFNSPWLQAYADIGNSTAMGQDVTADIESARGHLAAIHVKDTRPGVYRNIPFGKGTVDFTECFRAIKNTGYSGMLLLEMWANDKEDTLEEVTLAKQFILEKMEIIWTSDKD